MEKSAFPLEARSGLTMAQDDFDIAGLAEYLHTEARKVLKMAERGHLPGRKVAGQWRFSVPEINLWLEQRIGLSDDIELAKVEHALDRQQGSGVKPITIAAKLPVEAIAVPLRAKTREAVIRRMTELAMGTGLLWDDLKMAQAVRDREELHPTALDSGVAMLHPRRPMPGILAQSFLALGRTYQGIPFGGRTGGLTDIFFLICSRSDQGHLRTLARLSRLLMDASFLAGIRAAEDARSLHAWIAQRENEVFGDRPG